MEFYKQRIFTRQVIDNTDITGLISSVADASAANSLGARVFYKDPSNNCVSFVYAKVSSLATPVIGSPFYWTDLAHTQLSDTPASAITYVASSDMALYSAAGVYICTNLTTALPYGWFQTGGYLASVNVGVATIAAGSLLVASNAAGTAPTADTWTAVAHGTAPATPEAIGQLFLVVPTAATATVNALVMGMCAFN